MSDRHAIPATILANAPRRPDSAPPNYGQVVVPQILTQMGIAGTLSRAYRTSDNALNHSLENSRAMRNEPAIMECVEARMRCVAQLKGHLEPDDPKSHEQQELVRKLNDILQSISRWYMYRYAMQNAIWDGRYGIQHRYNWQWIGGQKRIGLPPGQQPAWWPVEGDKIVHRYDDGRNPLSSFQPGIRVGAVTAGLTPDQLTRIEPTYRGRALFLTPHERRLMTIHYHIIEDAAYEDFFGAGYVTGVGIRHRIYWTWLQMVEATAWMMEYIERCAWGMEIWYFDPHNPESEAKTRAAAEQHIGNGRNIVLVPRDASNENLSNLPPMERIEPGLGGVDACMRVIQELFGHRIKRYIMGQTMTSESQAAGLGSDLATIQFGTWMDIVRGDALCQQDTLTEDLIRAIQFFNFPDSMHVRVRYVIDTETEDSERKLNAWKQIYEMGVGLKESELVGLVGATLPDKDDKVVSVAQKEKMLAEVQRDAQGQGMGNQFGGATLPLPNEIPPGADPGQPADVWPQDDPEQFERRQYAKWTGPHKGPRGGTYWQSDAGEKHYGDGPPDTATGTIDKAADALEKHGHKLLGGGPFNLATKEATYRVRLKDGSEQVVTAAQAKALARGAAWQGSGWTQETKAEFHRAVQSDRKQSMEKTDAYEDWFESKEYDEATRQLAKESARFRTLENKLMDEQESVGEDEDIHPGPISKQIDKMVAERIAQNGGTIPPIVARDLGIEESSKAQPADNAIVNVPLAKRGNIDAQLDAHKKRLAAEGKSKRSIDAQQAKADKAAARDLFAIHGNAIAASTAAKHGVKESDALAQLDSMVKWEPAKALRLLKSYADKQGPAASGDDFSLQNEPARKKQTSDFHDKKTIQKNLIDGLDALPGQRDLFEADERLTYEWITIGGKEKDGKQHAGGFPVEIDSDGKITKGGPKHLRGKHVSKAYDSFRKSRKRKENRGASFSKVAEKQAQKWDMSPEQYKEIASEVWRDKLEQHDIRERAKEDARKQLGVTAGDVARLENQGRDSGSKNTIKGLDTVGRSLAGEYPELGWGGGYGDEEGYDHSALVWDLIREGKQSPPAKNSPEFHAEVEKYLENLQTAHSLPVDYHPAMEFEDDAPRTHHDRTKPRALLDGLRRKYACRVAVPDSAGPNVLWIGGLPIFIENQVGSIRSGIDKNGEAWETVMTHPYGFFRRMTSDADGDEVDVFVGPNRHSESVTIINQVDPETRAFDEHKVVVGADNEDDAVAIYEENYSANWRGFDSAVTMNIEQFKHWLDTADTSQPAEQS